MPETSPVGALILAGGRSSRFGGDKRVATLPDGTTVLRQTIKTISAVFRHTMIVLREDDAELAASLQAEGFSTVCAVDSALGMGHSLAAGINAISERWSAAAICLGDMPYIQRATLAQLVAAASLHPESILVPRYSGSRGHPVVFPARRFNELGELTGDNGARRVLGSHPDEIVFIEVEDAGVLADIDRPEDLNRQIE